MSEKSAITGREFLYPSNLLSLFRIALIPFLWFFLAMGDNRSSMICLALLIAAGISDALDGYVARRRNQVSHLGLLLDPLSDKILALALVLMLLVYRDFPIWTAALIVGRDLLLLVAGRLLIKRSGKVPSSNVTGKYAFAILVALLAGYVIRFEFSITLLTPIVVALLIGSILHYGVGLFLPTFRLNPDLTIVRYGRYLRYFLTTAAAATLAYQFYLFLPQLLGN